MIMFSRRGENHNENVVITKGGQTAILVRWSTAQRTTEMLAYQLFLITTEAAESR